MPPSPATAGALGAISLLCFVLVGVTWDQRRVTPLATPLSALFLAIGWWNGSYALFLAETPSPSPDFWVLTCYVGVVAIPPAVLVFALRFAGWDRWPGRGAATALLVEPAVVLVVLASNERYRLLFGDERAPERIATADGGAVFWLNSVYSYVLLTVSLVLVARVFWSGRGVRRRQAGAVLIALLVPWLVSLILLARACPKSTWTSRHPARRCR